jgi:hypothetical protein
VECGFYLPDPNTINVYFMKEIMNRERRAIKAADMKYMYVPMYDSLSIKNMLEFAFGFEGIDKYFPIPRDIPALPRQVSLILSPKRNIF